MSKTRSIVVQDRRHAMFAPSQRCASNLLLVTLLAGLVGGAGCSKEEINQAIEDAKAKTQTLTESAVQAVEERLPETGSIKLDMNPTATEIRNAQLELITVGDGRPNVIQIASYDPGSQQRTFPAVLIHGITPITSASALAGETVNCSLFFQATESGPIAMTPTGGSVSVTFETLRAEDNALSATLGKVDLVRSDDSKVQIRGGELVAVIQQQGF